MNEYDLIYDGDVSYDVVADSQIIVNKGVVVKPLSVTENGTYQEDGTAYSPVAVAVPGIVPTGTLDITENGDFNVAQYETASVRVPVGGNVDGLIDGSVTALENDSAHSVRREFASIAKRYNYHNLPSGYTEVEYIESSGTQYINTGVTGATPKTASFRVLFVQRGVTQTVSGVQESSAKSLIFLQTYYGTSSISYGGSSSAMVLAQNKIYDIECMLRGGYQQLTVDGAGQIQTTKSGEIENSIPFYLFAHNNNGSATGLCIARIYEYILRNGNATGPKACHLIPCREEATGKYGMYDLVSNSFKGNQGTGEFTGGAEIPNLTYGYTSADLNVTEIGAYAFYNNDLASLTLRANQVVTLGEHALDGTPIASGTGRIYVPSALVNEYKTAWSSYAGVISSI